MARKINLYDGQAFRRVGRFGDTESAKLAGIEDGAEVNVQPDWDATSGDARILNKPTTISDAQATKLAGIEDGAEVNPRHVALPFRSEDGNSVLPGTFHAYKSDNSQWQGGSSIEIAAIEIDPAQFTLSQNPQTDNAAYTGWHSLADDLIENGGSSIWTFQRIGNSSPFAPVAGEVFRVQVETLSKNDDGHYVLGNLVHLEGHTFASGTGYNWQVVAAFAPPSGADAVIGVLARDKLPTDVVYAEDLQGHETDEYASYTNGVISSGYRSGSWSLFTGSGAPSGSGIGQPDIASGSGVVVFGRTRTDRDPNKLAWGPVPTAAQYPDGRVIHAYVEGTENPGHVRITLTGDGTLVGTGDAAYVWAPATWVEVGDVGPVDEGNWWRLSEYAPSDLDIRIPARDVIDPPWVKPSGTELDDSTLSNDDEVLFADGDKAPLGEVYEHHDQFHTGSTELAGYTFQTSTPDAVAEVQVNAPVGENSGSYSIQPKDADDKALLKAIIIANKRVRVSVSDTQYVEFKATGGPADLFGRLSGNFPAASYHAQGSAIANDAAVGIKVHSNIPARSELPDQVFNDESPNIAGKGGTVGQKWTRGTSDENGYWADDQTASEIATALAGLSSADKQTLLAALGGARPPVEALNVTALSASTWTSLAQTEPYTDDTVFEARLIGLAASNRRIVTARFRLGDLDTNAWWLPWGAGAAAGFRVQFRRSAANTLQYQKQPSTFSTFRLRLFILPDG